jgi:hypothetical protein
MILPAPCVFICRDACLVQRKAPVRLVSITCCQVARSSSITGRAVLRRLSIRPNRSTVPASARSTAPSLGTSSSNAAAERSDANTSALHSARRPPIATPGHHVSRGAVQPIWVREAPRHLNRSQGLRRHGLMGKRGHDGEGSAPTRGARRTRRRRCCASAGRTRHSGSPRSGRP